LEKEKKERLVNQKINMIEKPLNMLDKVDSKKAPDFIRELQKTSFL
jgi:hypothetical protein